ncbi:hypothetical protein PD716_21960 [Vibrio gigantis]|uniref:hypothetical protein n=2 Tax=Vibrio TaxID=662 RepID=UPI002FC5AAEC
MFIKPLQTFLLHTFTLLRLIPNDVIFTKQLDRYPDITKRLDEYRELIENIENQTHYFSSEQGVWSKHHALLHDEYLQYLLTLRNPSPHQMHRLRERPKCLTS